MPSNHLVLCHPLLLLPSIFPSIWVFSNESVLCIRWPKYWSFSFSPSNEYLVLISFRFDLLAVQGALKSLLQHQSSKAWILRHLAFLMVQPSHPYMTTGKIIALTIWSFVGNWYSSEQRGGPYPGKLTASEGDSQPKGTYKLWGQNKSRAITWCRSIFRLWWSSKILLPFSKNNLQKVKHMIPSKYMSDACIKILLNSFMRVSVWCYNQFKGDFEEFFF